jgi:hypothetical protein
VQFAADTSGGVHALAWDHEGAGPPVASLTAAAAWATLNADLVVAANAQIASPTTTAVVQHVFTRDAKRVRGLLDTGVKIHLVLPVASARGDALVAGELN